jgi:P-type Ca2+ transporter type 2C
MANIAEISPELNCDENIAGLTDAEAAARLALHGFNELPSAKPRSVLRIALEVLREPMLLLLLACGGTYLLLGDIKEAVILLVFVVVVITITLYQEHKTERALAALRDLSSPRALVIRNGQRRRIAGRDVVPGDVLVLSEGDRVPADSILLTAINLATDESLLTGESVPVRKQAITIRTALEANMTLPGGDDLPCVYSGTLIVRGSGLALAKCTGAQTELGKIGKSLQGVTQEPTMVQRETTRLVRVLALSAIALCGVLIVIFGLTRGSWLRGFLAGLTLAMSILPEELPVILTVFLALGAWRMSRNRVLTRRVPAIETGTLTMNRMSVTRLHAQGETYDLEKQPAAEIPEIFHELAEFAMLASQPDPFDPMDRAIRKLVEEALRGTEHIHVSWRVVREYPLAKELLAISEVWISPDRKQYVVAAKGAPEAVADLCHLTEDAVAELHKTTASMAAEGLRVLGVAKAQFNSDPLPRQQHDFVFDLLGLIALADPVRSTVPGAIQECRKAGIRVIMITGDYPTTAVSIARQIGLGDSVVAVTGPEVMEMNEQTLCDRVATANVFARTVPEQKLQLVNALKSNGEIVAMTGDGVNDSPALKAAHIGIAMGQRGTDVARESADLVLLDDDFSSIVQAVRLGRRIFDNLKKAMAYTFAIHVPIAGLSLIPVLFRWPLILQPVHIAFLELIIDPACSIVFEAESEEADVMQRPPRSATDHLFNRQMVTMSLMQGFGILVILVSIFAVALYRGQGEEDARALTFTALVIANVALIVANRSWSRSIFAILRAANPAMWWVAGGALVFLTLVLYVPFLRTLFHFSTLHLNDIALCLGAGALSLVWLEGLKALHRRSGVQ